MPFTLDDTVVIRGSIYDTLWSEPSVQMIDRSSLPKKDESGDFLVEVVDAEGNTLYSNYFSANRVGDVRGDNGPYPPFYSYTVKVPAYEETHSISLFDANGNVQYQHLFTNEKPTAAFLVSPTGTIDGSVEVSWECTTYCDKELIFELYYSATDGLDNSWVWVRQAFSDTSIIVDTTTLPASRTQSRFRLVTTDGIDFTEVLSEPFQVGFKPAEIKIFKETIP